jgi:hypothetical protein
VRLSKPRKTATTVLILCSLIVLLVWTFLKGRIERAAEEELDQPVKAPARVSVIGRENVITVDGKTQKMSGIITKSLVLGSLSVPGGNQKSGVVVPYSAVVWIYGKAWIYIRKDAVHFVRREVPVDHPSEGGWFSTERFSPGDRVTVQGAQLLLSEEFRSQIRITD